MKPIAFIQSLLPTVTKSSMLEDIRFAISQLRAAEPILQKAGKALPNRFKDEQAQKFQQSFNNIVKGSGGKNAVAYVASVLPEIQQTLTTLEAVIQGEFEETIATRGLNYKRATLLQLTDAVTFFTRFTYKFTNYLVKKELTTTRDEKKLDPEGNPEVTRWDEDFMLQGLVPYANVINILGTSRESVVDKLDSIPDILATDANFGSLRQTVGDAKLDPFMFSSLNFRWSPIRSVRMRVVEAKHARAEEAEKEWATINLRLAQLERARAGREDPGLEREVNYLVSVSEALSREIADLES